MEGRKNHMNHQKKIFGIIGLGRFGFSLAESLSRDGQEIIVIDNNENKIREASAFTDNSFQVEELSREALEECDITELELNNHFVNLSVKELELRQKFGLNIVAIRRQDGTIITDIAPETEINGADTIVVCGKKASILQLENKIHHA